MTISDLVSALDDLGIPPTHRVTRSASYSYPTPEVEATTATITLRADGDLLLSALSMKVATLNAKSAIPSNREDVTTDLEKVLTIVAAIAAANDLGRVAPGRLLHFPDHAIRLSPYASVSDALALGDVTLPATVDSLADRIRGIKRASRGGNSSRRFLAPAKHRRFR